MVSQLENALRILRRKQVQARTGLPRATLYQQISEGAFPRPIKLTRRAVGWVEADVEKWLSDKVAESRSLSYRTTSGGSHDR
jgi:prophage regulatory protein